jgi:hypothetical protein
MKKEYVTKSSHVTRSATDIRCQPGQTFLWIKFCVLIVSFSGAAKHSQCKAVCFEFYIYYVRSALQCLYSAKIFKFTHF